MLDRIIAKQLPKPMVFGQNNWKKWTLAAVLYGLRRREIDSDFLNFDSPDEDYRTLAKALQSRLRDSAIYHTKIPPLALKGIMNEKDAPSLPELILRFLEARANDTDVKLAGGIGLTS